MVMVLFKKIKKVLKKAVMFDMYYHKHDITLMFNGWEIVLKDDGTWHCGTTDGG